MSTNLPEERMSLADSSAPSPRTPRSKPPSRVRWFHRNICSLHFLFVGILLFCVIISTSVAWVLNVTVAYQNATSLAQSLSTAEVHISKTDLLSTTSDSMYFTRLDFAWMENSNWTNDWNMLLNEVLPRFIMRQVAQPKCSVIFFGTASDLLIALSVEERGTPGEQWLLHFSNTTLSPMYTQVIQPFSTGKYDVLSELATPTSTYQTSQLEWYVVAPLDVPIFTPIYFSGATPFPYLFASVRHSTSLVTVVV